MIPLSIPNISGNELQYVKDCLDTGWISSAGAYVTKFEEAIKKYTGGKISNSLNVTRINIENKIGKKNGATLPV